MLALNLNINKKISIPLLQRPLVKLDAHSLMLLIKQLVIRKLVLSLHAFLVSLPEFLHRVTMRTDLLHVVVDDVDVGVGFAVALVQLLALVAARREEAAEFG